jgi:hypothetical protein
MERTYRSIFLAEDWAHQRYFGWRVVRDEPGLRVLGKRRAVVERFLVLLTEGGPRHLDACIARLAGSLGLADIVVHDFVDAIDGARLIGGRDFRRAEQRERLLNVATFVLDLEKSEEALLSAMTSDYRRKIKKAEAAGVLVTAYDRPAPEILDPFLAAFRAFAGKRGLNPADPKAIAAMYADGRAVLLVAEKDRTVSNYLHLYKAGDAASFMYGLNLSKVNDGAGQYLHWQAMRRLKADGVGWYDLGGAASVDPADGIYNFKEKFGGTLVPLGTEWRHTGYTAERGLVALRAMKTLTSRVLA